MALIIISAIVIVLIAFIAFIYNRLIRNKNRMQEAWSIIDVFLKKRHDLIPPLVETVKGYSFHEQKVLEEVTRLRSEAIKASNPAALMNTENNLGKTIHTLFTQIEAYPELKASDHYLKLQQQITDIENDLEKARRYYNGTVRENNIYQESFPSNIIAGIFGFEKGVFFNLDTPEKAIPTINL